MHDQFNQAALDEEFRELEAAVLEATLNDTPPTDDIVIEGSDIEFVPAMPDAEIETLSEPVRKDPPGVGAGFWGTVSALAWVVVAVGAPVAFIGRDALQYQHPAVIVGIVAVALAPAILILLAAAGAREARRVRRDTAQLTLIATEALAPTSEVEERARSLGQTVRAEIGALQSVVESALDRFAELEAAAARNAQVFDEAVANARDGAGTLSQTLQGERIAFEDLTTELRTQSDTLGENVGRQIRLMREASRMQGGRVHQVGTPWQVYARPATLFVASFVGAMNVIEDLPVAAGGTLSLGAVSRLLPALAGHERVTLAIRLEDMALTATADNVPADALALDGAVDKITFAGREAFYRIQLDNGPQVLAHVHRPDRQLLEQAGARVRLTLPLAHLHLFDAATGRRIEAAP